MSSKLLLFLHAIKSFILCLQEVKNPKVIQFLFIYFCFLLLAHWSY